MEAHYLMKKLADQGVPVDSPKMKRIYEQEVARANADLAAGVSLYYQDATIVFVESTQQEWTNAIKEANNGSDVWYIDAIDSSSPKNLLSGEFSVNLARIANQKPVWGIIYEPISDRSYFAEAGKGAFCLNFTDTSSS